MNSGRETTRLASYAPWLVLYAVVVTSIVVGVNSARSRALEEQSTPEAEEQWQKWREEAAKQTGASGPVQRRPPKTAQPPNLILLRDHYGLILVASIVLSSVLFGFTMFLVRGAMRSSALVAQSPEPDPNTSSQTPPAGK